MRVLLSLLPWLGLAALIWYMAACVSADKKPKAAPDGGTDAGHLDAGNVGGMR